MSKKPTKKAIKQFRLARELMSLQAMGVNDSTRLIYWLREMRVIDGDRG